MINNDLDYLRSNIKAFPLIHLNKIDPFGLVQDHTRYTTYKSTTTFRPAYVLYNNQSTHEIKAFELGTSGLRGEWNTITQTNDSLKGISRFAQAEPLTVGFSIPFVTHSISFEPKENRNDSNRTERTSSGETVVDIQPRKSDSHQRKKTYSFRAQRI